MQCYLLITDQISYCAVFNTCYTAFDLWPLMPALGHTAYSNSEMFVKKHQNGN